MKGILQAIAESNPTEYKESSLTLEHLEDIFNSYRQSKETIIGIGNVELFKDVCRNFGGYYNIPKTVKLEIGVAVHEFMNRYERIFPLNKERT